MLLKMKRTLYLSAPHLALLVFFTCALSSLNSRADDSLGDDMHVNIYTGDGSGSMHDYKIDLLFHALDVTRDDYNDFSTTLNKHSKSYKRVTKMIAEGEVINVLWAPALSELPLDSITALDIDYSKGLLGYRVCLVDKTQYIHKNVTTLTQLRTIKMGLGAYWFDLSILKHNQLTVLDHVNYERLFDLLRVKRFDCIPLGINEITSALKDKQAYYPNLTIEPSFLIHYDYPMRFYVNNQYPRLIERLNLGFKRLEQSGKFNELFVKYHAEGLQALNLHQRHLICLNSLNQVSHSKCEKPDLVALGIAP